MCKPIRAEMLDSLRAAVKGSMSPYRFAHTAGVEQTVAELALLFGVEATTLRAAALLHDITKEWSAEKALAYLAENGISLRPDERISPKVYHGITAVPYIKEAYAPYATETLLSAVRWHTTGRDGMTLAEALLYLADYIEDTRTFEDCVYLRNYFWSAEPQRMSLDERERHLWRTVYLSLDMTVRDIESVGGYISEETLTAKAAVMKRI